LENLRNRERYQKDSRKKLQPIEGTIAKLYLRLKKYWRQLIMTLVANSQAKKRYQGLPNCRTLERKVTTSERKKE
jgi:hypothetical protein